MPTSTWYRLNPVNRERVLEAAQREFGTHGYSTGSLNTIAREADIAKGSLFQYFEDKLEFFTYVAEETASRIHTEMERRIAASDFDQSFTHWLGDVCCMWADYFAEHPLERGVTAAINLEIPILLIRGKLSDVVSPEGVADFLAKVPHAELVELSDAGHTAAGDDNDAFTDAVVQFVNP